MKNDPGLFTDSTGEGMAGAEDVALATQRDLKKTYYNGSKPCIECGFILNPVQSLQSEKCPTCSRRAAAKLIKGRMA
jgi:predicted RNA-binding Zn-ribbon protein involved in translation (DUF1610 family)